MYNWNGDNSNWWDQDWSNANGMNVMMMPGRGGERVDKKITTIDDCEKRQTRMTDDVNRFTNTGPARPITLHKKYEFLFLENDIDDDSQVDEMKETHARELTTNDQAHTIKHRLNKRQRMRRNAMHTAATHVSGNQQTNDDCIDGDTNTTNLDVHTTNIRHSTHGPPWRRNRLHNVDGNDEQVRDASTQDAVREEHWRGVKRRVHFSNDTMHQHSQQSQHNAHDIGSSALGSSTTWCSLQVDPNSSQGSQSPALRRWDYRQTSHYTIGQHSSVLWAGIGPTWLRTQECQSHGEDDGEVMPPIQASPTTKLLHIRRYLCNIAQCTSHYSVHEDVPDQLVPCPSTCTCPSPIIVAGDTSKCLMFVKETTASPTDAQRVDKVQTK